jgi:hypothetical protein
MEKDGIKSRCSAVGKEPRPGYPYEQDLGKWSQGSCEDQNGKARRGITFWELGRKAPERSESQPGEKGEGNGDFIPVKLGKEFADNQELGAY